MKTRLSIVLIITCLAFILVSVSLANVALEPSAAFDVNSTADMGDANPGDGQCDAFFGQGVCTLRAAIQEANALAGNDSIIIPSGVYTLTLLGPGEDTAATGDLDISDDASIQGDGAAATIIDGGGVDTIFHILEGADVDIANVTIQNGNGAGFPGGLSNDGILTLRACVVTSNSASDNGTAVLTSAR